MTVGTVQLRPLPIRSLGNVVMKGYLKNPKANKEAFSGGWYHSGDLAVKHPDNYIEIKDRSKDIIISGGENISSVEVENVLFRHEDVRWGASPCAFVTLTAGVHASDHQKAISTWPST